MERDWESTFRDWSKPSSDTEEAKCINAESMIRAAIRECDTLRGRNIEVFAQGSYRNNTNVRVESDVDICVLCSDTFFYDFTFANGFSSGDVGIEPAKYPYPQFKNEVEQALVAKFGRRGVTRGNKAFDVHETSYRVDADVVPCFEHRRYTQRLPYGRFVWDSGTQFLPDDGRSIINWPQQQYENGVAKNKATSNRYKYMVRALKRLRYEMEDKRITAAKPIPSFLIECLVWNVPNEGFGHYQYTADMRYVLAHTFNETISDEKCKEWGEVSERKYLFRPSQPWTRDEAHAFLSEAWDYIGFE